MSCKGILIGLKTAIIIFRLVYDWRVAWQYNGNGSDWRPKGLWINSESVHCQVTTLGKLFTYMCLCSPSSIIWSKGGDAVWLGREPRAWWKVLAAYHRVYDHVTCGLTAFDRNQLQPLCSLLSMGYLYLYMTGSY